MATGTFSPVAGANFPVDGRVSRDSVDQAFTTIRTSAGNEHSVLDVAETAKITASTTSNQYATMRRGVFAFNSTIPLGNRPQAGSIGFYVTANVSTMAGSISIVLPTPAATNNLADSDYNIASWNMTKQATDIAISALNLNAYNYWVLNSTGLNNVKVAGTTVFGAVTNFDADNSAPTWSSGADSSMEIQYADSAGNHPPLLIVTYAPNTSSGLFSKIW